ncbi:hypothetical protein HYZ97_03745 [Candidatus Pacearchaeota archaeon]|nr:hypothetical protein [Candidatus Pacearchaeota archaeon]
MNRDGQPGKTLTSFPVMILIFIVLILYLASASFAKTVLLPRGTGIDAVPQIGGEPILSQVIEIEVDNIRQRITVLDGFILYKQGKLSRNALSEQMEAKLNERQQYTVRPSTIGQCVILVERAPDANPGYEEDFFFEERKDEYHELGNAGLRAKELKRYQEYRGTALLQELRAVSPDDTEKLLYIYYYEGACV